MAGSSSDDYGVGRSLEGFSRGQHCQSGEALAEWRLCEQVDNGTPSTSPPYWDTDDGDDNDGGEKPSELYGKYTWKIEKFSQTSKRELKSEVFEVGSYKWYILIYPQGCDVCNHLSLFLCVANHDKLLPGWSHFAQFTIAVVNKDPKKSKYSDTLHRFCKKEHDWGWKKFMELSKVQDGFIVADTLEIRAQVQVIREKVHRPFRCLDRQYRRELVRVYLTNVEQICRRFVEERRGKLGKLFEDKVRWSSFCSYWLGVDQYIRNHLSREKTDVILRVVVKQFFVEKEVTSTLVMDSLNSGLKALECQSKSKKGRANLLDSVETSAPIVRVENDMFVLVDDVLPLLERAALEPLPPKDEKGPQNRTKDGSSGQDFSKDSIERDERRLTELGRRTLEIFVLAHIFSNRIEIAFQEAVALKRQEELIREEEASGQAENEQKARRRVAEKEKRAKKKLNKQRRSSRKGKDRDKDEKCDVAVQNKNQRDIPIDERTEENSVKLAQSVPEQPNALEDVSDVSDIGDDVGETLPADSVDRDASPVTWETDTSEIHPSMEACSSGMSSLPVQHGQAEQSPSSMDDSSSTCSTDSVPSVVTNGPYKGNMQNDKSQTSPSRGKNRGGKETHEQTSLSLEMDNQLFDPAMRTGHQNVASRSCSSAEPESKTVLLLKDQIQRLEQHLVEKEENVVSLEKKLSDKDQVDVDRLSKQTMAAEASASPRSHTINFPSIMQLKSVQDRNAVSVSVREEPSTSPPQTDKTVHLMKQQPQIIAMSKSDVQKTTVSKPVSMQIENPTTHQVPVMSRPSSAPLVPGPRSTASTISMVQTAPSLSQSMSEAGRLGSKPSPATHSYVSHSCRNAIMGKTRVANVAGFVPSSSSVANPSLAYSQPTAWVPSPRSSVRTDQGFTFGSVTPEVLHSQPQWTEGSQWHARATLLDSSLLSVPQDLGLYGPRSSGSQTDFADEFPSSVSARQAQRVSEDEFPHLDIINYLLDEELGNGKAANEGAVSQSPNNGYHHPLSPPFTFPNDMRMLPEMGSAINLCRFERPVAYHDDEIRPVYGSFNSHINGPSDAALQIDFSLYGNQQIDGVIQNQWPVGFGSDLSLLGDAYPFHMPEYSNLACGVNGYTVFQSSNGH